MKNKRIINLITAAVTAGLCICGAVTPSAADNTQKTGVSNLMPRQNIILNAYLVPLQNEEIRTKMLEACRDADIDILSHIYVADTWVEADHTFDRYKELMAEVDKYGMKLLTRDTDVQHLDGKSDAEVRKIAEKYKDLPGFGGFYVVDEPFNPNPYARVENILREVCPEAYVNVNFLPRGCYPEGDYIRQLKDYGGLIKENGTLSLDVYTFTLDGGVDENSLFSNYDDLRKASIATNQNSAVYVQSVGLAGGYRRPSAGDLRYNMMAALAYGIKEIKFFTWGTPPGEEGGYTDAIFDRDRNPTELYTEVCKINKKIHKLGTYLAASDAVEVYHSRIKTAGAYEKVPESFFAQPEKGADVILTLMKERGNDTQYLMVVNKNFKSAQTTTLTLNGIQSIELIDELTGTPQPAEINDGKISLTLAAGDAALYRLPSGDYTTKTEHTDKNLALGASVRADSSEGASGLYLSNLTDGITDTTGARLVSDDGKDRCVTIDLGKTQSVNRIDMYPSGVGITCGQLFPDTFKIELSENGKDYTAVAQRNGEKQDKTAVPVFRFEKTNARYVKITVSGFNARNKQAELGDIAVYNDDGSINATIPTSYIDPSSSEAINIALGKPIDSYSSTTDQPAWTCEHSYLTDGDLTRAWASELFRNDKPDSEEWIAVDLLDTYDIARVELTPRDVWNGVNVFPEDYEIQVSLDGENYTTVASVKGDNNPQTQDKRIIKFDTVPARYVKLLATKLTKSSTVNGGYAIEISEMEVFCGKKAVDADTTENTITELPDTAQPTAAAPATKPEENKEPDKNKNSTPIIIAICAAAVVIAGVAAFVIIRKSGKNKNR